MNILLIGQCTLHWGRMEFGNIGNYYILEPLVRQLHARFPGCTLRTTFQLSERFCQEEKVQCLPMSLYYGWHKDDLPTARREAQLAREYVRTGHISETTPYIDAVLEADLVIDFSGDIWGDNADFLGPNRFLVGLMKDKTAIDLGKPVAMLAGSPGPFSNPDTAQLARKVYAGFSMVSNREPISTRMLESQGFDLSRTHTLACPSFLFEAARGRPLTTEDGFLQDSERPLVGFVVCGWNFPTGPFDRWPREDHEYAPFVPAIEHLSANLGARVCLFSHANGFDVPPAPFRLKHGRDYPIIKQLEAILATRGIAKHVFALDGVYDTWSTKALIGRMDMLVSGRIHAAAAGFSQHVPTVVIDYGHEPKAHKLAGFAATVQAADYVADPTNPQSLLNTIDTCWNNRDAYRLALAQRMPVVQALAERNFSLLADLI